MINLRGWLVVALSAAFLIALGARGHAETGLASYYGGKHHGRPTASGGRFSQWGSTCAHRRAPFGTVLRVTTKAGRAVDCIVTDRGPFIRGRIVDLSVAHAMVLGMIGRGVVMVTVERAR